MFFSNKIIFMWKLANNFHIYDYICKRKLKYIHIMKKYLLVLLVTLCSLGKAHADSIFVDSGIAYKIVSADTVNVVKLADGKSYTRTFNDSLLTIPATISHDGKKYRVKCIEQYAFSGCTGIKSVFISEGVEEIHDGAFEACANLESISLPSSVIVIGEKVFPYCINLTAIAVGKRNPVFDSRDGCNAIVRTRDNTLLYGCKSTQIPSSVVTIGSYAFIECMMETVDIPVGVVNIECYAFCQCEKLKSIHISSSVEKIRPESFWTCYNISTITVDEGNEWYDSRGSCNAIISKEDDELCMGCSSTKIPEGVISIGSMAFAYCIDLYEITIPEGVKSIKHAAFWDCCNLKEVKLPSSLERLLGAAFKGCISLVSIDIPQNVKEIGWRIFWNCASLQQVKVDPKNPYYDSRHDCNAIVHTSSNRLIAGCNGTVIVDGIKSIGEEAFGGINITSIHIPASVEVIYPGAFKENELCRSITVDEGNLRYKSDGSNSVVNKESHEMVLACSSTKILPEVTSIGKYAYTNNLSIMVLPEGIDYIHPEAFRGNKNLHAIIIPASVKEIGREAFRDCENLTDVVIMGNNTEIYPEAFSGCDKLNQKYLTEF